MDLHDERTPAPTPPIGPGGSVVERCRAWIRWFGLARLVTSAVSVVVVVVGAWWLARSPAPPTEASLPRTTTTVIAAGGEGASTPVPTSVPAPPATTSADPLVVHVAGAVRRPGVYEFTVGRRIADAVARAGGATADGRPHRLNLAAPLVDGMRVVVPVEGETVHAALSADAVPAGPSGAEAPGGGEPIDVNAADTRRLEELPGVGPATAAAIVADREASGPFASVDDLERVRGIGPATLERLRPWVTT